MVAQDEREQGLRAILNFGHTFGHAIEAATAYEAYLHGEAVALGMLMAADLSCRLGMTDAAIKARVRDLVARAGLPTDVAEDRSGTRPRAHANGQKSAVRQRFDWCCWRGSGAPSSRPPIRKSALDAALREISDERPRSLCGP